MSKYVLIGLMVLTGCMLTWGVEREFLLGGDISMLTRMEELGAVFKDANEPGDFIEILKNPQPSPSVFDRVESPGGGGPALFQ